MGKSKKNRKSLALFVLAYLLMFLILVGGCLLVGFGYKTFVLYDYAFKIYHSGETGYNTFIEYLNNFNANVVKPENGLVKASIDMFAPGVTMIIISIAITILLVIFHVKKPKNSFKDESDLNPKVSVY